MKQKQIDTPFFESELIAAECIMDVFANAISQGIESISTREILSFLGINNLDNYNNVVYDLTMFTPNNLANLEEQVFNRFKPKEIK